MLRGKLDSHEPFFLFKHQFLKFCNSFVPDFENLHNLIHLNDVSDANTMFDDSSISDSETLKVVRVHHLQMCKVMKRKCVPAD